MKNFRFWILISLFLLTGACATSTSPTNHFTCFVANPEGYAGDLGFAKTVTLTASEENVERATGTFRAVWNAEEVKVTSGQALYDQHAFSACTGQPASQIRQDWTITTLKPGTAKVTFTYTAANGEKVVTLTIR